MSQHTDTPPVSGRLQLNEVSKSFLRRGDGVPVMAVDYVSLDIPKGEFVTLLGPSGCGKTTTLRLIAGFEMPTSGQILLDDQDITNRPPNKRDMGMVFQSYALFPHMSVFDNITYGLELRKISRQAIKERVNRALEMIGLTGLGERRPNQLSGGQQQRVALARAMVIEPRVLLFDEPLSNLDAKLRVQMRSEIRNLQKRMNITSIYVTHDQTEAMAMSDRIVVMNAGHIEQVGIPSEIYRRPASRFVADFIGRANFIQTKIESVHGDGVTVRLLGQTVSVSLSTHPNVGDKFEAVLRPEGLKLRNDPSLQQVRIEQAMYLGSEIEYIVQADGQNLIVVDTDPRSEFVYNEGQTIGLGMVHETIQLLPLTPR